MKKDIFPVNGMACAHCAKKVEDALRGLAGVNSVCVNLEQKQAEVEYDPAAVTPAAMAEAVDDAGFELVVA